MVVDYVKHKRVTLKSDPVLTEKWLQERIAEDPSLLNLGDLDVKAVERVQPTGGRLDMLLYDAANNTRYEVEIQLGETDESHIIRVIEYWDIERRRWPQYEHVGVIVAEKITARFFNVISLFNGSIPLIAIQVSAVEVGDAMALVFTTVLDRMPLGVEEQEEAEEPKDRHYWEEKASPMTLTITDRLLDLVRELEPTASLKYNKNYIGIARDGVASNFVQFRPKKQHVIGEFKIPRTEELDQRLDDAGVDVLTYQPRWSRYQIRITDEDLDQRAPLLRDLIVTAHQNYGL